MDQYPCSAYALATFYSKSDDDKYMPERRIKPSDELTPAEAIRKGKNSKPNGVNAHYRTEKEDKSKSYECRQRALQKKYDSYIKNML